MLISICSAPEGHDVIYVSDPKEVIENEGSLATICGDYWKEAVVAFGLTGADVLVPIIIDADGKVVEAPQTVDGDDESYGGICVGITTPDDDDPELVDKWVKDFFFGLVADMVRNPSTTPDAKRTAEEAIKEVEEAEKDTTSEYDY